MDLLLEQYVVGARNLAAELTADQCSVLAGLMAVRDLEDGEILVKEGASDSRVYALVSGALGVSNKWTASRHNIHVLTKGDLAGELGFMDAAARRGTGALGPSRVLSLEREKLESLLKREPLIVYRVMRAIFRVVHVTLNRVAIESRELTNYMFKVHGKY